MEVQIGLSQCIKELNKFVHTSTRDAASKRDRCERMVDDFQNHFLALIQLVTDDQQRYNELTDTELSTFGQYTVYVNYSVYISLQI